MPNLKLFQLTAYQNVIIIKSDLPYLKTQLKFHRDSAIIEEIPLDYREEGKIKGDKRISYILGIFKTFNKSFIVLVEECTRVAKVQDQLIYHIDQIAYVPVEDINSNNNKDILDSLSNQKKLLQQGFYFSINGDITLAKHFQKYENSFVWNNRLLTSLRENNISTSWQLSMIQGYVEQIESYIDNQQISVTLISRRSRFMGGTRYYSRGVNDDGHVANFIETEQILTFQNILISFASIRGSVPIFWNQDGINTIKLTRSKELTQAAFVKHFNLLRRYGKIYCVNLMQSSRQIEQLLIENFAYQFQKAQLDHVNYQYLDFHSLVKNGKTNGLNQYIYQYEQILDKFQCYVEQGNNMVTKQEGVFRVNCLDCLDRTNLFMSKICLFALDRQLKILKLSISSNPDILDQFDESNKKLLHDLIIKYKNMWANNGDMLSFLYSGAGSTVSEMAREGKRGIMGMLKDGYSNLERFYNRQFEDDTKQNAINQLLCGQASQTHFDIWIQQQEKQFCFPSELSILLTTWNVGGNTPITKDFSYNILQLEQETIPDIVVFGLQEIVDLNPQNIVIMSNEKTIQLWDSLFSQNLKKLDSYTKIGEADLVGLYICVYVKTTHISRVTEIDTDIIKTGLGGTLGNKGGVAVKFKFDDSLLGFTCCHLTSGGKQLQQRVQDVDEIHQKAFSSSKYKGNLNNLDYSFFFGDMNFRIDLSYQETVEKIKQYQQYIAQDSNCQIAKATLAYLLNWEQLGRSKNKSQFLQNYQEGSINFLPTYKYDKQSQIYDTSKKQRTPSWCDRILVSCKEELISQQRYYKRSECLDSDHRPVSSYYIIEVKKIDKDKLDKVKAEYCLAKLQKKQPVSSAPSNLSQHSQSAQFSKISQPQQAEVYSDYFQDDVNKMALPQQQQPKLPNEFSQQKTQQQTQQLAPQEQAIQQQKPQYVQQQGQQQSPPQQVPQQRQQIDLINMDSQQSYYQQPNVLNYYATQQIQQEQKQPIYSVPQQQSQSNQNTQHVQQPDLL